MRVSAALDVRHAIPFKGGELSSSGAHARLEVAVDRSVGAPVGALISDSYRDQNRTLHDLRPEYGGSSGKWVATVAHLVRSLNLASILDYGCGKGLLKQGLAGLPRVGTEADLAGRVREYDPAIPGKDAAPAPAELVVCTDVLEHVEPVYLDAVLDDLRRLTLNVAFLNIATRPAEKTLPDGRNAHLIVEPSAWWLPKLKSRWTIASLQDFGDQFVVVGSKE